MIQMVENFQYLNRILLDPIIPYIKNKKGLIINGSLMGARWSSKTKSQIIHLFQTALVCKEYNIRMKGVVIRYTPSGAKDTFEDMVEVAQLFGVTKINKTERSFVIGKHQKIVVDGFISNKTKKESKLGGHRPLNLDLLISVVDEIFEFPEAKAMQQIYEALGGATVEVRYTSTNPFSKLHWKIYALSQLITIDKDQMDTKGYMFKDWWSEIDYNDEKTDVYNFIHWSNHRVNEYLTASQHAQLIDLWETDPIRAKIVERGEMGSESGGVYTDYIHNNPDKLWDDFRPIEFFAGADLGITSDATSYILMAKDAKGRYAVLHEWYYDISKNKWYIDGVEQVYKTLDLNNLVNEAIDFYHNIQMKQHFEWNLLRPENAFTLKMDTNGGHFTQIFNTKLYEENRRLESYGMPSYNINGCYRTTKIPIIRRINLINYLWSRGRLYIDAEKCPRLMEEMIQSVYKKDLDLSSKGEFKRLDGKDHSINAMEYAFDKSEFNVIASEPEAQFYDK